tara:strand:- start:160 stop:519 length:360 start_codon:yes stop_codon:yes gene_type:complete
MSRLEIILTAILIFSLLLNAGLIVYARGVIVRLLSVSEELGDLQQMINSFAVHLKSVYEMEMFYGDQTLAGLVEHAVSFNEYIETFEYIYSLTEVEKAQKEGNLDDNTEPEEEDEEETK